MFRRRGFVVAAQLLAGAALLMHQLVTTTHSVPATVEDQGQVSAIDLFGAPRVAVEGETNGDEPTDVYGNQVAPAVATYGFDFTGTPYELHSPQTQLPRLASPKS
jgi:hypothetical protein